MCSSTAPSFFVYLLLLFFGVHASCFVCFPLSFSAESHDFYCIAFTCIYPCRYAMPCHVSIHSLKQRIKLNFFITHIYTRISNKIKWSIRAEKVITLSDDCIKCCLIHIDKYTIDVRSTYTAFSNATCISSYYSFPLYAVPVRNACPPAACASDVCAQRSFAE